MWFLDQVTFRYRLLTYPSRTKEHTEPEPKVLFPLSSRNRSFMHVPRPEKSLKLASEAMALIWKKEHQSATFLLHTCHSMLVRSRLYWIPHLKIKIWQSRFDPKISWSMLKKTRSTSFGSSSISFFLSNKDGIKICLLSSQN